MVDPDIFIKTLIKQKLICGIVFEFKREKKKKKDGWTTKPLQSRSALSMKGICQPRPVHASSSAGCPDGFARSCQKGRK